METGFNQPKAEATGSRVVDANTTAPVFDKPGMLERMMGDEGMAKVILEGFLQDTPEQIQALRECLAAGDVVVAERQAHSIKGSAANVGGEALRAVAYEMEKSGRAGDLNAMRARLGDLITQSGLLSDTITSDVLT